MDATNVVTSTDTAGIGYHHQEQLTHPRTITTTEDDHHALDTPQIDVMTGEATADPMLGYTRELFKTPQHRQAHQLGQKPRTETHTRPQLNAKPITLQTAVK